MLPRAAVVARFLTAKERVLQTQQDLLIEFYSPMCGHCTHFAPTYAEVASRLVKDGEVTPARMDLYHNDLPKVATDAGFDINAFPTLILVRRNSDTGKLKLIHFDRWRRDVPTILGWIRDKRSESP
ncbi:Protein disulfide-isomerase [Symbiodinium microadriaticum]|uniref:Protein disulfide-isomerase n=1 Tax=Symbiodinium microadriaticum TaxID=2951 RepID=A0A1Q9F2R1_SYMMI|nr:Protein disulfide-isomerase [Symbiodinium microadriaticum]